MENFLVLMLENFLLTLKKELKKIGFYIHYIGNASCFHVPYRDMVVIASKSKTNSIKNYKWIGGRRRSFSLTKRVLRNLLGTKPQYSVILTESDSSACRVSESKPILTVS